MKPDRSIELYRNTGRESRIVNLSVEENGSIRLYTQDMGESVAAIWGDDDYEFWIDVPSTELSKLVLALLRARYAGRGDAVDDFRKFCTDEGVTHKWESWV